MHAPEHYHIVGTNLFALSRVEAARIAEENSANEIEVYRGDKLIAVADNYEGEWKIEHI